MISDAIPSVSVKKKFNLIAINLYLNRGKGKSIKGQGKASLMKLFLDSKAMCRRISYKMRFLKRIYTERLIFQMEAIPDAGFSEDVGWPVRVRFYFAA